MKGSLFTGGNAGNEWKVPLDRFLWEHEEKLIKKGYMGVKIDG